MALTLIVKAGSSEAMWTYRISTHIVNISALLIYSVHHHHNRHHHHCPFYLIFLPRHTKSGGVLCYTLQTLSRPSAIRLSVSASFPCSNFSTFWPVFLKLCIDIGIGEEWYGIASRLISFWNNRVMALDLCQKCFALRFHAATLVHVPFYRFSLNFA